jgi:hypothetical protein
MGSSGNTWDDELGANITTESEVKAWDAYVAVKVFFSVLTEEL